MMEEPAKTTLADPAPPARLRSAHRPSAWLRHGGFALLACALAWAAWSGVRKGHEAAELPAGTTPEVALSAYVRAAYGLEVQADQVVFLAPVRERHWSETLSYTPLFFLARPAGAPDEPEDVYFAEARTASDHTPLDVRRLSNLTSTPYAREVLLKRMGDKALFKVEVFGQVQSLLLVDFAQDERELPEGTGRVDRWRYAISRLQDTGRLGGVGMRLYGIKPPTRELKVEEVMGSLDITLGAAQATKAGQAPAKPVRFILDPRTGAMAPVQGAVDKRVVYQPRYFAGKDPVPWLVDTVRNHPLVGPRKIAKLERFAFYWKDRAQRVAFSTGLLSEDEQLLDELAGAQPSDGDTPGPSGPAVTVEAGTFSADWPPPSIKPRVKDPKPGEGKWSPIKLPWLRTLPGAPPAFMKTAVRMDPKRTFSHVVLIAMDMRQLDVNMVAGTVTPESSFGTRGTGQVPRDPKTINRLVAAFNGGFKTAHGAFGMQVDHQVILPAMPFAATAAVADSGQARLGSWNNSMAIPADIRSLRQNLPPLVADGKLNPTGKRKWGGTASELDGIHTTRSGLCMRAPDTLIYVWSKDSSADALGYAMLGAGCEFGMHLDMNPTHTGWAFYRAEARDIDKKGRIKEHKVAPGSSSMRFRENRYIYNRDVKDFFYLVLRETFADGLPKPPEGFSPWAGDQAPSGVEGFLPLAAVSTDPTQGGAIVALDLDRLRAKARRGDREPDASGALDAAGPEGPIQLTAPVAAIDLGLTDLKSPFAFFTGGRILAPPQPGQPALVRAADGRLDLLSPARAKNLSPSDFTDVRGGPALLVDGALTPNASSVQGPVHALGVDDARRLYYIVLERGSGRDAAERLRALGVKTAMLLPKSPRSGDALSQLRFLKVGSNNTVAEIDPLTGAESPIADDRGQTTHVYFERVDDAPRVARLDLKEVELSKEEARRQRRMMVQIQAMRQELRSIENTKYKKHVEEKGETAP